MGAIGWLFVTLGLVVLAWSHPRFQTERESLYRMRSDREECSHVRILDRDPRPFDWDREVQELRG